MRHASSVLVRWQKRDLCVADQLPLKSCRLSRGRAAAGTRTASGLLGAAGNFVLHPRQEENKFLSEAGGCFFGCSSPSKVLFTYMNFSVEECTISKNYGFAPYL